MSTHRTPHTRAVIVAIIGTALVTVYALWAGIQILVLNPLAAAPGKTLAEIHTDLAGAGETFSESFVIGILAIGPTLALITLVTITFWRASSPPVAVMIYCTLLTVGAFGYFGASFGPGMSLADTYMISGADASPWAIPLYIASILAVIGAVAAVVASSPRRTASGAQPVTG